jgi:hypothetical protein
MHRTTDAICDGWYHIDPIALKMCPKLPGAGTMAAKSYFWRDLADPKTIVLYQHDDTEIVWP